MNDIGAEKGIIVSKIGFQQGAHDMVRARRNVDLFTFEEIKEHITDTLILVFDKHCSKCGEWVIDTTLTCPKCGTSLLRYTRADEKF